MDIEPWKKAGKIAAEVLEFGRKLVKKDASILEVADKIEAEIIRKGARPAFPVNISLNEVAAHQTPEIGDERKFKDELVKLDVGVGYEGAIGDTACTIDLSGKYSNLIKASEEALANAIKLSTPGTTLGEIGKAIEETIKSHGFEPIRNLSGHGLEINNFHAEPSIPNYDSKDDTKLEDGQIIAIEPFATDGAGLIVEGHNAEIFQLIQLKPLRDMTARQMLGQMMEYEGLPFASRWFKFPKFRVNLVLKEMDKNKMLILYPQLIEKNKGMVSQAEHSVVVGEKPLVLTRV